MKVPVMQRSAILGIALSSLLLFAACGKTEEDPLVGHWQLDRARSSYARGTPERVREEFTCTSLAAGIRCTIYSELVNGKRLNGSFTAAYDGVFYDVVGMPDVNQVALRRASAFSVDATFSKDGVPRFGYKLMRNRDGRTLVARAVDPKTRRALNSIVFYDRK